MSASHRKGKGKATGTHKRGDSSQSIISLMHDTSWREKNFTPQEKANQLLPTNDPIKFANREPEGKANSGHRGSHRDHSPAPSQVRSARWFCTG
ncbi:hypothetical protein HN873_036319 [Arachis hypogaea]